MEENSKLYLLIIFKDEFIRSVEIDKSREQFLVFGRDSENDISLEFDDLVSRRHGSLSIKDNVIMVRDLDSRNGIFIQGERKHQFTLTPEESFHLGETVITLSALPYHAIEKTQIIDDCSSILSVKDFKKQSVYLMIDFILTLRSLVSNRKNLKKTVIFHLKNLIEDLFTASAFNIIENNPLLKSRKNNIDEKVAKVLTKQEAMLLKETNNLYSFHDFRAIFPFYKTPVKESAVVIDLDQEIEDEDFSLLHAVIHFAGLIIKEQEAYNNLSRKLDLSKSEKNNAEIIGRHDSVKAMQVMIEKIANVPSTVLVTGESGTGKELIARNIHNLSFRSKSPFVAVNCASIPETLIESELFGHVKGSFTGADNDRPGKIEMAEGGTLFLDEIGEMPVELQGRLLRFLEEGEVQKIGSDRTEIIDVRVVAATNRNLEEEIIKKKFRKDLFFRLSVIRINAPPLRERVSDIKILTAFFIEHFNLLLGKKISGISEEALNVLKKYSWPGNIRELRNVIERACVLSANEFITPNDLAVFYDDEKETAGLTFEDEISFPEKTLTLSEIEKKYIHHVLAYNNGNKQKTAHDLGITRKTLYTKLKDI